MNNNSKLDKLTSMYLTSVFDVMRTFVEMNNVINRQIFCRHNIYLAIFSFHFIKYFLMFRKQKPYFKTEMKLLVL